MVFDARAIDGSAVSASPDASQANRVPWRSRAGINHAHGGTHQTNARGHMFGAVGVVACTIVAVLVFSDIVVAHYFGGPFADNDQHRYASIERNDAHFDELDPYFSGSMFSDYEVDTDNDINTINNGRQTNRPANHVDVYWYATSQNNLPSSSSLASATCVSPMSSNKCDQFRIKFSEDNLIGSSHAQLAHTVCHEIGHTFGSDDGHTASVGCWPQSTFSLDGDLSDHEINHLRDRY